MMNHLEQTSIIIKLLKQQNKLCHSLVEQLILEKNILDKNQTDQLSDIAEKKNVSLESLNAVYQSFLTLLKKNNLPTNKEGMKILITQYNQYNSSILPLWNINKELLSQTKKSNEINGKIIYTSSHQLNQFVHTLFSNEQDTELYSESGNAQFSNTCQSISKV